LLVVGLQDGEYPDGQAGEEEEGPFEFGYAPSGAEDDEDEGGEADEQEGADEGGLFDGEGSEECGDAEDAEGVKEAGADEVAGGDAVVFLEDGGERDDEFGHGGCGGDDGECDDPVGDASGVGEVGGGLYEEVATGADEGEPGEEQRQVGGSRGSAGQFIGEDGVAFVEEQEEVGEECCCEDESFEAGEVLTEEHEVEGSGAEEQEEAVAVDEAFSGGYCSDEGTAAEDEADVEDVRADDVADGDVLVALEGGADGGGEFWGGGAKGDDGESDDEFGDAEPFGESGGGVDEPGGAECECEAGEGDGEDVGENGHLGAFRSRTLVILGP